MLKPAVNIMIKAARQAGTVIIRHMSRLDSLKIVEKARQDYASEVDSLAEAEIIRELKRSFPDYAFLAEESGAIGKHRYTWVIDPLDGTSNFLHGWPHFCVSIALLEGDEPLHGVIYDPLRNELFVASRGAGALLNDRKIRVSERKELTDSLIITGHAPRERKRLPQQLETIRLLLEREGAEDIRRSGSAALDLAYVACGRVDAFYEAGLLPWDVAAGLLLVREAGGRACDFKGSAAMMKNGHIVAGNIKVCDALQKTLVDSGYAGQVAG
ncbi:MAG TPA: inositol monophosphatase [Xanthomonadales bacterium]|nr:inositol monophosphatase [Xanthomonadales bacterium]